jgi:hypothetical protein
MLTYDVNALFVLAEQVHTRMQRTMRSPPVWKIVDRQNDHGLITNLLKLDATRQRAGYEVGAETSIELGLLSLPGTRQE